MRLVAYSNFVTCFDWPLGKLKRTYTPETNPCVTIKNLCWSPNSDRVCIVTSSGNLEIISYETTNIKSTDRVNLHRVNCAIFPNHGQQVITITQNQKLIKYQIHPEMRGKILATSPDGSAFDQCCYSFNDNHLCASTMDHNLYLFNTQNPEMSICFPKEPNQPILKFDTSNQTVLKVAAVMSNGRCHLWDASNYKDLYVNPSSYAVNDFAFDQGTSMLCVTNDGRCIFRDVNNASTLREMLLDYIPQAVDYCMDGIGFAITDDNGNIFGYDVRNTKRPHCKLEIPTDGTCSRVRLAFERSSRGPNIALYDVASQCKIKTVSEYSIPTYRDSYSTIPELEYSSQTTLKASPSDPSYRLIPRKRSLQTQTEKEQTPEYTVNDLKMHMADVIRKEFDYVKDDMKSFIQDTVLDGTQRNFTNLRMAMVNEFINLDKLLRDQLYYAYGPQ